MNALVIYFSKSGNTKAIAETIAATLGSSGNARTLSLEKVATADLKDIDVVVFGSPTYRMNLPAEIKSFFESAPKRSLRNVSAAAFDTSYKMSSFLSHFTAAKKLTGKLRRLGGKIIVPPQTFYVTKMEGPRYNLYDSEIERAKAWAETILGKIKR